MSKLFCIPKGALALSVGILMLLIAGCGEEKAAPPKPKQVRQKIVMKEGQKKTAPAPAKKAAGTAKTQPAGQQEKAVAGKPEKEAEGGLLQARAKVLEERELKPGEWRYDPTDKLDPFKPLFQDKPKVATVKGKLKRREVPLTPLTRVDLSQLKLTAIITAAEGNKALVEEASGKGYVISVGTDIGNKAGRVAEISFDKVIVDEEVENLTGGYVTKQRELTLPKPPGEF